MPRGRWYRRLNGDWRLYRHGHVATVMRTGDRSWGWRDDAPDRTWAECDGYRTREEAMEAAERSIEEGHGR